MKPVSSPEDDEEDDTVDAALEDRRKDYSDLKYVQQQLGKLYNAVERGFEDKRQQNSTIDECWDIFNCKLNENQTYCGTAQVYVPIVRDAIKARETRFINALFPQSGRYVDVVGNDGIVPYDTIALMDYYVRATGLRRKIVPAMIRAGDISGNYNLYIDWMTNQRNIITKKKVAEQETELGTPVEGSPEYDDVEYEEVIDEKPDVMVLDSRNLLFLPATADDAEDAEVTAIVLRLTEDKIRRRVASGIFEKEPAESLIRNMSATTARQLPDTGKKAAMSAGVTSDSKGNKVALIFQVWTKLKIRGEYRMMVTHFGGANLVLGCKRNPYWCDWVPVISQPVEKNPDTVWGKSQVEPVKHVQYAANDVVNMGLDSAQYSLLPIVMTDPEKNPRVGSMILSMAAIWETNPNDTQFAQFPQLWKDAFTIVAQCKEQVQQSLGINPAMIPQGNASKKPTQAQIAQEQQVALESTADDVSLIQEGVLSRLLQWFYELDYQYRTKEITVRKFGTLGLQADMDQVPLNQTRQRYEFKWYGTEAFKAAQQVQQMISWTNVLKEIPPQMLNGRKLDIGPVLEYISEVTYGPRIAPKVLVDVRHQLAMQVEQENELLENAFPVQTHPMDDDMQHIQSHLAAFKETIAAGFEPVATLAKGHILEHMKQAKEKAAAAQGAVPGSAGAPRPGATPQMPTGVQNPPGAPRPDAMALAAPRKSIM